MTTSVLSGISHSVGTAISSAIGATIDTINTAKARPSIDPISSTPGYNFDKRVEASRKIRQQYPDRVPVILRPLEPLQADRHRLLCPIDTSFAKVTAGAKKYLTSDGQDLSKTALFFMTESGMLPCATATMSSVYDKYKHDDGFLYIVVCLENTYG